MFKTLTELLSNMPTAWATNLLPEIRRERSQSARKLVVLDDDPTGTQTIYNVPVLTEWSPNTLKRELDSEAQTFYILTNSRSLPLSEAKAINHEIGTRLRELASPPPLVVSRSDSTLRGHYPGEPEALANALGITHQATLLIPFFQEGGRFTINDIHYVQNGDALIPVGESEFAQDATFGFRSSDLRAWVTEKSVLSANQVVSLSLADIRCGPEIITKRLLALNGQTVIVNAAERRDLEVVALAALRAERKGKHFLYRTAASFVQVLAGLAPQAPLSAADFSLEMGSGLGGGLVVVGSYVPRSTRQLNYLLEHQKARHLPVAILPLLEASTQQRTIDEAIGAANEALSKGEDVIISTQRELLTAAAHQRLTPLEIGQRVSSSLVAIVRGIETPPRYFISKGGITSSDLATRALSVKRAWVRGQLLPGVSVWELGQESRFPGLLYVVFPGNVGDDDALTQAVQKFRRAI